MQFARFLSGLALGVILAPPVGAATKTEAHLLLSAESARPGETVMAGVRLKMPGQWHTYWKNAGDSGAPTKIDWKLPEGIKAGDIQWPVPEKVDMAGLTTYAYHNEVLLMVPLAVAANAPPGRKELKAKVSWLECAEICVPGKADVQAVLEVGPTSRPSTNAALFDLWRKRLPKPDPSLAVSATWEKEAEDDSRPVIIEVSAKQAEDFYPFGGENFEVGAATEKLPSTDGKIRFRKVVKRLEGNWPSQLQGIVVAKAGEAKTAYEVKLSIAGEREVKVVAGAASPPSGNQRALGAKGTIPQTQKSLPLMLLFAFVGGLILNVMPCVLPVIALKILGFVNQGKESPAQIRRLGLVYGLGVLVSFLILAGIVIAVQQTGKAASWGMQFQNPKFLIAMTVLVTLVALNLFGVFEVTLGGRAMGVAGELASKEGTLGAFFNGVLATALATPCTAPFLAPALGFAFSQSAGIIVLIFLSVGLGLAAPYVVLSWQPAWLKFLPKPGVWMERFKRAMGFPMLATAVWLFSLTTPHFGKGAGLWLGLFLVLVALASWVWGEFVQRGTKRQGWAMVASLAVLALGYVQILEGRLDWRSNVIGSTGAPMVGAEPGGIEWKPWSTQAVEKARAEGRPVFVDFTADWCFTCQANKKTSIEIRSVRSKLKEINAVPLLGDYTREDDAITAELLRWGRAGVPLVLVYPADPNSEPIVLPALLTPGIVLDALEKAAPKGKVSSSAASGSNDLSGAISLTP